MADPHVARVDGDRLFGRGAYDMKAGVAAALIACREAAGRRLAGDVVVAAVADEEHASLGVQEALRAVRADAAVVTEPTELDVVVAHRGFVWAELEVTGQAAHGSRPHLGVDAIVKAGPLLTALGRLDAALAERTHPLLGRGSVHASTIDGRGRAVELPGALRARARAAHAARRDRADVEAELDALLDRCRARRRRAARRAPHAARARAVRGRPVGGDRRGRGRGRRDRHRRRPAGRRRELLGRRGVHRRGRNPDRHVRPGRRGRARPRGVGEHRGHRGGRPAR